MNSHVLQPGTRANATPGLLEVGDVGARQPAGDNPGIVVLAGKASQDGACLGSERDDPSARLDAVLGGIMLFASGHILYLMFQDIAPQSRLEQHWAPPLGAVLGCALALLAEMLFH